MRRGDLDLRNDSLGEEGIFKESAPAEGGARYSLEVVALKDALASAVVGAVRVHEVAKLVAAHFDETVLSRKDSTTSHFSMKLVGLDFDKIFGPNASAEGVVGSLRSACVTIVAKDFGVRESEVAVEFSRGSVIVDVGITPGIDRGDVVSQAEEYSAPSFVKLGGANAMMIELAKGVSQLPLIAQCMENHAAEVSVVPWTFSASRTKTTSFLEVASGAEAQSALGSAPIWCGGHHASACEACPQGHGDLWCNGMCAMKNSKCQLRSDLVWCGWRVARHCGQCPASNLASYLEQCSGDCLVHNNTCVHYSQVQRHDAVTQVEAKVDVVVPTFKQVRYYNDVPLGAPDISQSFMQYWADGCCRFDSSGNGTDFSDKPLEACMKVCLTSYDCIAVDVRGPVAQSLTYDSLHAEQEFGCRLYAGAGDDFRTECLDEVALGGEPRWAKDATYTCWRKVLPGSSIDKLREKKKIKHSAATRSHAM